MNSRRRMEWTIAFIVGCLGILIALKPATCWTQAEIDPDHYDTIPDQSETTTRNSPPTDPHAYSFRGKFTLPFDASCAGLILPQGTYSVLIRSFGKRNFLTLIPDGKAFKVQTIPARLRIRSSAEGPSVFVLERAGQQHMLTGIRLKQPWIILDLQPEQRRTASTDTELVPISEIGRGASKN